MVNISDILNSNLTPTVTAIILPLVIKTILSFTGKMKNSYVFSLDEFRIKRNNYYSFLSMIVVISVLVAQLLFQYIGFFSNYTYLLIWGAIVPGLACEIGAIRYQKHKWEIRILEFYYLFFVSTSGLLFTLQLLFSMYESFGTFEIYTAIYILLAALLSTGVVMFKEIIKTYAIVNSKSYVILEFTDEYLCMNKEFDKNTAFDLRLSKKSVSILIRNNDDPKALFKRIECPRTALKYYGYGYQKNLSKKKVYRYNGRKLVKKGNKPKRKHFI